MLDRWLTEHDPDEIPDVLHVRHLTPTPEVDPQAAQDWLGHELLRNYVSSGELDMLERVFRDLALPELADRLIKYKFPSDPKVRSGDFGEALSGALFRRVRSRPRRWASSRRPLACGAGAPLGQLPDSECVGQPSMVVPEHEPGRKPNRELAVRARSGVRVLSAFQLVSGVIAAMEDVGCSAQSITPNANPATSPNASLALPHASGGGPGGSSLARLSAATT
ncbi:hypothetical protein [Streptosporangium sandarakinum]|uniref:hypothetical protein n=1 Tax=Streptosporangium sandarakinum TaxID=1260955 RepID=UPI0037AE48B1